MNERTTDIRNKRANERLGPTHTTLRLAHFRTKISTIRVNGKAVLVNPPAEECSPQEDQDKLPVVDVDVFGWDGVVVQNMYNI